MASMVMAMANEWKYEESENDCVLNLIFGKDAKVMEKLCANDKDLPITPSQQNILNWANGELRKHEYGDLSFSYNIPIHSLLEEFQWGGEVGLEKGFPNSHFSFPLLCLCFFLCLFLCLLSFSSFLILLFQKSKLRIFMEICGRG